MQDIVGKKGFPLGKEMMEKATEEVLEVTYWWPRPGSEKPLEKHTFYTKVAIRTAGVGLLTRIMSFHDARSAVCHDAVLAEPCQAQNLVGRPIRRTE